MASTPLPGDELRARVLGGRYQMVRLLGRGGMGAVWAAHDRESGAEVAVKVVKAALVEDAAALERFRREMRVMAGLTHANIVRGLDAGEDEGVLWLAMELLRGETLRERLDARGRLPWQESLGVLRQMARGLSAAHRAGVVHRDLKPENVMIAAGPDGAWQVKLLDFGVAKASVAEGGQSSMTGTGFIVGTPGYVAPEVVLEGKTNDPRSDFYALGVVWYELVTGQKPFTAKTAFALAMRHAHERPPTFNEIAPFAPVPGPVENVVMRLMAKSPEERPPDAETLLLLIEALEQGAAAQRDGAALPNTFDATLTDVRETPDGTAVVPLQLRAADRAGHGYRAAAPTPATGLAPAAASASPSTGLELFKQLPPRMKLLMVSGAVLLPLTAIGLLAVALVDRRTVDEQPPRTDGAWPVARRPIEQGPPAILQQEQLALAVSVKSLREPGQQTGTDGPAKAEAEAEAKAKGKAEGGTEPGGQERPSGGSGPIQAGRGQVPERSTEKVNNAEPPVPSAPPPLAGLGRWSLGAPGRDVKVVLDGVAIEDPPIVNRQLAVGEHTVRLLDRVTGAVVGERTFTLKPGEHFSYVLRPEEP